MCHTGIHLSTFILYPVSWCQLLSWTQSSSVWIPCNQKITCNIQRYLLFSKLLSSNLWKFRSSGLHLEWHGIFQNGLASFSSIHWIKSRCNSYDRMGGGNQNKDTWTILIHIDTAVLRHEKEAQMNDQIIADGAVRSQRKHNKRNGNSEKHDYS